MAPKRKKGNPLFRFFFNPKFISLVALVAVAWLFFPLSEKIKEKREIDKEIEDLNQEISQFENKNQKLEELTKYLQSEQFVEEQARMNLGLKKEGEEVVVIQEGEGKVAGAFAENGDVDDNKDKDQNKKTSRRFSNMGKWWDYFFGKKSTSSETSLTDSNVEL